MGVQGRTVRSSGARCSARSLAYPVALAPTECAGVPLHLVAGLVVDGSIAEGGDYRVLAFIEQAQRLGGLGLGENFDALTQLPLGGHLIVNGSAKHGR